jgi:5-methylcytosine-specific restriction endonuclease McrA
MGDNRPSAKDRGYGGQWGKARAVFLAKPANQFCVRCKAHGILNAGHLRADGSPQTNSRRMHLVVDHVIPHRGDTRLFWDRSNWQPLCPDHHDITKQQEENGTFKTGTDIEGRPLAHDHPWNVFQL